MMIPCWIVKRLKFFKCWLGIFYMAAGLAIGLGNYFEPRYGYYIMIGCFSLFWLSLGAYLFFRDPVAAEKALWDAVEKRQEKEKVAQDAS